MYMENFFCCWRDVIGCSDEPAWRRSTSEPVQGAALAFQSVDDIKSGNSLELGLLSLGDRVAEHVI